MSACIENSLSFYISHFQSTADGLSMIFPLHAGFTRTIYYIICGSNVNLESFTTALIFVISSICLHVSAASDDTSKVSASDGDVISKEIRPSAQTDFVSKCMFFLTTHIFVQGVPIQYFVSLYTLLYVDICILFKVYVVVIVL